MLTNKKRFERDWGEKAVQERPGLQLPLLLQTWPWINNDLSIKQRNKTNVQQIKSGLKETEEITAIAPITGQVLEQAIICP